MASSTKPEVHNLLQRRQRKTKPRPTWKVTSTKIGRLWDASTVWFPRYACRQTDRHKNTHADHNTSHLYTAKKYPYMSTDILRRVFHILTEPVPYTFVSVNRRNNEAWTHTAIWARASLFRRFTDITRSIWKMLGPFATASRLTPTHQVSLPVLSRAACVSMSTTTTTTRDRGDRYGPMEWAQ